MTTTHPTSMHPTSTDVPALLGAAARTPAIDLAALQEAADLQTRRDRKYLVPVPTFRHLIRELDGRMHALDIGGRRVFRYQSIYFDTPHLDLFRDHLQGRRLRNKVRTRLYVDSGMCLLEVKGKGPRAQTVKHRLPWDRTDATSISGTGRDFVAETLHDGTAGDELMPVLTSRYQRATFVDLSAGQRMTCDVDLSFADKGRLVPVPAGHVLVETKSEHGRGILDRLLRQLGVREQTVSKYCAGICLLRSDVRANPWQRTLTRYFGYVREAA